jgi:hypothetical protein
LRLVASVVIRDSNRLISYKQTKILGVAMHVKSSARQKCFKNLFGLFFVTCTLLFAIVVSNIHAVPECKIWCGTLGCDGGYDLCASYYCDNGMIITCNTNWNQ